MGNIRRTCCVYASGTVFLLRHKFSPVSGFVRALPIVVLLIEHFVYIKGRKNYTIGIRLSCQ